MFESFTSVSFKVKSKEKRRNAEYNAQQNHDPDFSIYFLPQKLTFNFLITNVSKVLKFEVIQRQIYVAKLIAIHIRTKFQSNAVIFDCALRHIKVVTRSTQRRNDVVTTQQRCHNVVTTFCATGNNGDVTFLKCVLTLLDIVHKNK